MMLRLRHLRLRAVTRSAVFGADLHFSSGLNVVHAGNTSGKSTCLQSIVYALGLERSLGPQLEIPLPYAMRERIHRRPDDEYEPVLESYVELEIENSRSEILVVRRDIVGGKDPKLVQTWDVAKLSAAEALSGNQRDFFVHDPGAAQREDGFHYYLAKFIGWELPLVPRFDGVEGPLYLEAIFPMLFVEQKRGWSAIQGPFPTFLRIQDVARRVMEFLLDLEAGRIRRERAELRRLLTKIQQRWSERRTALDEQAGRFIRFRGIPSAPTAGFAHASEIAIEILHEDEWQPLTVVLEKIAARRRQTELAQVPTADSAAPEIERNLVSARDRADRLTATIEIMRSSYSMQLQDHRAIENRLAALEIDLKRNQDALKLKALGSELGHASYDQTCPTCHQSISSELLPTVSSVGMALEENIAFVTSQIELYRATAASSTERLGDYQARYYSAEQELREVQHVIRDLRQALVQPSASPSLAVVEEIVRLQTFLDRLQSMQETADALADELRSMANEWASLQDRLKRLLGDDLTPGDKEKVGDFQATIQRHLGRYGFRSFQPTEIELSRDNFRPMILTREDDEFIEREINFEVSASDAIRLKWAYYLSLLSISKRKITNHCGLVIFDEPGQQEIEAASLHALFQWAAQNLNSDQQVVVATSEPIEDLSRVLTGLPAKLISFDGFILQPLQ